MSLYFYKKLQIKNNLEEKSKSEKKEKKSNKPENELDAADVAVASQPKFVDPFASISSK